MKKLHVLVLVCALSTTSYTTSFAQKDAKKVADKENDKKFNDKKEDDDFVVDAADGGLFEVQAAELSKTNASSVKVKELAEMMIKDHSKANEELKAIARKKNITLPTKLGDKNQKAFDKLTKLKGAEFDKEYADMMVSDHKEDIDMFQKEADKGYDGELKAWAAGKLATLKHHLSMAESTKEAVKNSKTEPISEK